MVKDEAGKRYWMLRVVSRNGSSRKGTALWLCRCDCGRETIVSGEHLRCGFVKSCGCYKSISAKLVHTRHGDTTGGRPSNEYTTWHSMVTRCHKAQSSNYANYGGRGISVCDRWRNSFEAFLADMGRRPSRGHSIDRIDVNGNYEPSNCRWATRRQQARNTRRNIVLEFDGRTLCLTDWAKETGISHSAITNRLLAGMTVGEALTTPVPSKRPFCKRGHPLSGSNLFVNSEGRRVCRECRRARKELIGVLEETT